ncbi:MAG: hypothetical protein HOW73_13200 [Polyangiaceae bacterium]|nr:hypothetical protein [Polyangiaceae bacterium]
MKWASALICLAALLFAAGPAYARKSSASQQASKSVVSKAPRRVAARSVGSPDEGKLVGGQRIERNKALRLIGSLRFALPGLVGMLERGAESVAKRHPGSILTVGDLSAQGGGDVDGHRSHESGRDADVGFYLMKNGKPFLPPRFAVIDEKGVAMGFNGVRFDDARNWALIQSFLSDRDGRVLQIFVAKHLRARLLAHAARVGASPGVRARAAEVLMQPRKALPHDNHFHVRIACPRGDEACINFGKKKKTADARVKKERRGKMTARPKRRSKK